MTAARVGIAGHNEPNIQAVLLDVKRTIATAKIAEFENQCYRLGDIVKIKLLSPPIAADILLDAAIASGLVHEHGDDVIQQIMAEGLSS
jgi:hypothetical protein